jgi:tRNA pseudouridine55 synthase
LNAAASPTGSHEGALVVDKPGGLTSHDVVTAVRRALDEPRVGHTGTLDPLATGVLVLLMGRATRLAQFVAAADKTYAARIRFGWSTDTDDETGRPLSPALPVDLTRKTVEQALAQFRGSFIQRPPAYSAKHVAGRRAYTLARRATPEDLPAVNVRVDRLEITTCTADLLELEIVCSAGFYVRALARDLGAALGTGAHLASLRRLASGRFRLEDALALETVIVDPDRARRAIVPAAVVTEHLPAIVLDEDGVRRVRHGAEVLWTPPADGEPPDRVRLVAPDGSLIAIAEPTARPGVLHPVIVLM